MSDETKASATVSDYLRWRGDLTFAQDGFNEVDNLLLCIISYIKLENIPRLRSFDPQDAMPMGDVCRLLTEEDEQLGLSTLDYIPLMRQAAGTPRFREVSLFAFESLHDEDRQMQFAAVSFLLPDGSCDLTPCPKRNLPVFAQFGIRADGTRQSTPEMEVFPVEYFCPVAYAGSTCDITPNTYSIHHYHSSWKEKSRAMRFDEEVMEPLLGAKFYYRYYRPFRRALGARRKKWRT